MNLCVESDFVLAPATDWDANNPELHVNEGWANEAVSELTRPCVWRRCRRIVQASRSGMHRHRLVSWVGRLIALRSDWLQGCVHNRGNNWKTGRESWLKTPTTSLRLNCCVVSHRAPGGFVFYTFCTTSNREPQSRRSDPHRWGWEQLLQECLL